MSGELPRQQAERDGGHDHQWRKRGQDAAGWEI